MKPILSVSIAAFAVLAVACGSDEKRSETPTSATASAAMASSPPASAAAAPSASAAPPPSASAPPAPPAPPPAKGKFLSGALGAKSGQVDKVGTKDGAFTPDGVKDTVFEVELDGAAQAFAVMSVDEKGEANGAFSADTYVGSQPVPPEVSSVLKQGKATAGVAVYEGDKVVNKKDGSVAPLSAGTHKLVIYVSAKDLPKGNYKVVAVFDDYSTASTNAIAVK
jgi:hypothetical protein